MGQLQKTTPNVTDNRDEFIIPRTQIPQHCLFDPKACA
jgi:hypothetical protein